MAYTASHAVMKTESVTLYSNTATDAFFFLVASLVLLYFVTSYLSRQAAKALTARFRKPHPLADLRKTAVLLMSPVKGRTAIPQIPWQFQARWVAQAARRRRLESGRPVNGQYLGTQPLRTRRPQPLPAAQTIVFRPVLNDPHALPMGEAPWDGMTAEAADRWATLVLAGDTGSWPALSE